MVKGEVQGGDELRGWRSRFRGGKGGRRKHRRRRGQGGKTSSCAFFDCGKGQRVAERRSIFTRSVDETAKHARAGKKREEETERKRGREGEQLRLGRRAQNGRRGHRSGARHGQNNGRYGAPNGRNSGIFGAPTTGVETRMSRLFIRKAWMPFSQLLLGGLFLRVLFLSNFTFHLAAFSRSV